MDPLKLLSRSTRRRQPPSSARDAPSGGQQAQPQLFPDLPTTSNRSKKRKRDHDGKANAEVDDGTVNFFGRQEDAANGMNGTEQSAGKSRANRRSQDNVDDDGVDAEQTTVADMPHEDRRRILKQHKLKITRLDPPRVHKKDRRKRQDESISSKKTRDAVVPQPLASFNELRPRFNMGRRLFENILDQGYTTPTEVQIAALPLLLDDSKRYLASTDNNAVHSDGEADLLSVAPTGSGKTLAFVVPLLERLRQQRRNRGTAERHTSAVILAPTKELVSQIVNEARKLSKNMGIRITQMRKGMTLGHAQVEEDAKVLDFNADNDTAVSSVVKADVIVSTPGVLQTTLRGSAGLDNLPEVQYLVLDEADVLLDPLFKEQTLDIWNGLSHPRLRVSLWSATMGSNVEELARATIAARFRQLQQRGEEKLREAPLIRLIVGLKDSAAPNVEHKLLYAASEQGKLMGLRQLLHPTSSSHEAGPILRPPFLVFTQTIERAIALHSELRYDIPAEAGGVSRISVLHADLSATARDDVMTRFRKGTIWVLITTDLLSRGVDFRGVNGVVNYDIPGSSAAYIHRIGRTGRAGREGGVAVTLYSKEDMSYLKHIANVMAMAQRQRGEEASDMQKLLLDALPKLSKNEKQALKKHGVKSRTTAKGQGSDVKAGPKTKISTKAGFVRRAENRKRGAKMASQRLLQTGLDSDAGVESDFAGFD